MQNHNSEIIITEKSSPTLIYCNGNAGLYEFNYFIDDWTQQVVSEYELNVVFWSYRGYGYSTGTPSIKNICSDIETLYDYLKNDEKLGKIGVFGTSLGGLVAAHLGAHRKIDFLYVDRSFACVSDIAYYTMFRVFKYMIRFLTDYDLWSPFNYLNATCYKAMSYDPNDEAIGYMASIMNGISKSVAQNIFLGQTPHNFYSENDESMRKNFKGFWRRSCSTNTIVNQSTGLWIPLQQQKEVYKSLVHILHGIKLVIEKQRQLNIIQEKQNDQEKRVALQTIKKNQKASTCNINLEIDESYILNNTQLISTIDYVVDNLDLNQNTFLNQSISMLKKLESHDIKIPLDQQSPSNYETAAHPPIQQDAITLDIPNIQKNKKAKYKYQIPKSEMEFNNIKQFIKSAYTLLDQYDASGLTLLDCISSKSYPKFQTFILNLFVWGSYPPVSKTVADNPSLHDHHIFAQIKTQQYLTKMNKLISDINQSSCSTDFLKCAKQTQISQKQQKLQQDLQTVKEGFEAILSNLKNSILFYASKDQIKSPVAGGGGGGVIGSSGIKSHNVTIDGIMVNSGFYQRNGESDKLNQIDEKNIQQQMSALIGNLLVVSCGHVDPYSKTEELAMRNHFKNAKFI